MLKGTYSFLVPEKFWECSKWNFLSTGGSDRGLWSPMWCSHLCLSKKQKKCVVKGHQGRKKASVVLGSKEKKPFAANLQEIGCLANRHTCTVTAPIYMLDTLTELADSTLCGINSRSPIVPLPFGWNLTGIIVILLVIHPPVLSCQRNKSQRQTMYSSRAQYSPDQIAFCWVTLSLNYE